MINLIDLENIEKIVTYYEYANYDIESIGNGRTYKLRDDYLTEVDMRGNASLWEEGKASLFRLFGNQLKIKFPLDEEALASSDLANKERGKFLNEHRAEFNPLIAHLITRVSVDELMKNRLEADIQILDVVLRKGTKVTRCFNQLEDDQEELERQQDLYSVLLQTLKIQGNLVLSIDLEDFITMSVSKSGWSSCHHPGSMYGTGGMAYAADDVSIMAYVETSTPFEVKTDYGNGVDTFTLSNKIWRQMYSINRDYDFALGLSQYPNSSEVFSRAAREAVMELLTNYTGRAYTYELTSVYDTDYVLQEPNYYNLEGYTFYCDYTNGNINGSLVVIFGEEYEDANGLIESVRDGETEPCIVGEEFVCACGCGYVNYTSRFVLEEADDYEDEDHYGNYY